FVFFFSSRRRHTRSKRDWSSDVCSSDLVYDQFHLVDTLEVSVSRIISGLNQCLKTCLHQSADTAAENCLLAKEVCLCLCTECCQIGRASCRERVRVSVGAGAREGRVGAD